MANISYEEILSIQRKANIVDIIRDYVPLTQRGKNYFGICPFHDDHNPSMSVSPEKGVYKCFVCGNAGNAFNFVMEYEKVSFYEAVKIVADKIGVSIDISTSKKENTKKSPLYDIYNIAYKFYQNNLNTVYGKDAKKYLLNRKIDEDVIKNFNIGLSLSDSELCNALKAKGFKDDDIVSSGVAVQNGNNIYDIYKNRIMFPLYDLEGNVVGFSGRIYNQKSESKYINTKETEIFKKGELLYNYHIAKKEARKEKNIIVVEGFMDVIRLSTIGIVNVVATMGTAVTKYQLNLIQKLAPNITLMFDGDKAGEKATNAFIELANGNDSNIKVVRLEDNLDPDEYILTKGKDKMIYNLSHAQSVYDYKLSSYKENIDFNDSKEVSNYINVMIKEFEKIDDDIVREIEIKKLSESTNVSYDLIKSKLKDSEKKVIITHKPKNIKINKYEKASKYILYRMINDNNMILYYFNNLSYLPNDTERKLASEIVLFYKKFNSFNLSDFIIYLEDKKELINLVVDISDLKYTEDELNDNIDNYFDVIKESLYNNQIVKLTSELKNESNSVKRMEIAQKIVDLKIKESNKDE
ncbi:MAG TPA: DNA primase [Firmicutes bacterium]|nr:DNA primase [Bacillota bacterium]